MEAKMSLKSGDIKAPVPALSSPPPAPEGSGAAASIAEDVKQDRVVGDSLQVHPSGLSGLGTGWYWFRW